MLMGGIVGIALLVVAWIGAQPWLDAARRGRIRSRPFPAAWRSILRERVPCVRRLPPDLQRQLRKHIQVFIAEKSFVGCDGLTVTDEMRVTIAAQACLLRLNRPDPLFPRLHQVLVYPGPFIVDRPRQDGIGVVHDESRVHAGESWAHGLVVLSWPAFSATRGGRGCSGRSTSPCRSACDTRSPASSTRMRRRTRRSSSRCVPRSFSSNRAKWRRTIRRCMPR